MWDDDSRTKYERKGPGYPSDVTDDEWVLLEPLLPPERRTCRRRLVNAFLFQLTTGCQWRQLPKDFPARSTVYEHFSDWNHDGVFTHIHHTLYKRTRELAGKAAEPTLAIVDSQSVKAAEKGGRKLIRRGTMPERRSRAKSATRPSIRSVSS
jgi:transposase